MRRLLLTAISAALLAACASPSPAFVTPSPRLDASAADATELSMGRRMPADFRPPHRCESRSLDSPPYAVDPLRWTFYCDVDVTNWMEFGSMLRDSVVGQGWRQCGSLLLFARGDLVMAIELGIGLPLRGRDPMREMGGRPAAFALTQWIRTGDCR